MKGKRKKCRFGFPQPPMPKTIILQPLSSDNEDDKIRAKENWKNIKKLLDEFKLGEEVTLTFEEMLAELQMDLTQYIEAVQTTIVRTKRFLKRKPCEI